MSIIQNCQKANILSRRDFHASPTQSPEREKPPKTSAIYGLSVQECYANYDREQHCLKTLQVSLFPTEGDFSIEFCRTFTAAGTLLNGRLYRLLTSARRTCGNGCGLLPTPTTQEIEHTEMELTEGGRRKTKDGKNSHSLNLADTVQMFPTPSANKTTRSGETVNADGTPWDGIGKPHSKTTGSPIQTALADYVQMWPTPRAFMHKDSATDRGKGNLGEVVGGKLNPQFVAWLMGYPLAWADTRAEFALSLLKG